MAERSESPSKNGLSHIWSKTLNRDKKNRDSASNSVKSTDSEHRHSVRESLESAIDKIKGDDESGDSNGLKKLVPKRLGSKRRRKKLEQEEEQRASEEAARGRSVAERGTLENDASSFQERTQSRDGSSLITYDSDTESHHETPPPLISHPSHTEYLTTSSLLVHSTIPPEFSQSDAQLDGSVGSTTSRAATFPINSVNLAASESAPTLLTNTLKAPPDIFRKRSPSPGARLKNALTRRGPSPNISPERQTGLGESNLSLEEKKISADTRRGSVASRIGAIFPDRESHQPEPTISSPERPRTAKVQPINTQSAPSTPPPGDIAPIIVNTPPTPTDTSIPRFPPSNRERGSSDPVTSNPNVVTSASGNMISHRRVRSGTANLGPSKLSNIISAPLTPTLENNSATTNQTQTGFFSSVFSAAQNAANTLSNSIANTSVAPGKNKSTTQIVEEPESPQVETLGEKTDPEDQLEQKEPAVKTLGMGDLSLSHLGISEISSDANTPIRSKFGDDVRRRSEFMEEDPIGGSTIAGEHLDVLSTTEVEDVQTTARPRSVYEPARGGEQTPPNGSVFEGNTGLKRSGSIRSAMGNRRKRGSSAATTGTTIGAAIAAANASVAHPSHQGSTPKITGFAVASKKRNRDFHQLFRSVPDDDYLIEDYSCALQREILAHGRLYVSEGHLCFSSNIFGWVTTLVMSFDEVVSVEKRSTALLFKNGLMISTLHAKNVFASFTSRDSTYDLIVGIWKLGHPSLRSSLNGVRIEETGGGDKTEKDDGEAAPGSQSSSEAESDGEEGDEIYDEDEDDEDGMSFTQADGSIAGSDVGERTVSRKPSAAIVTNGSPTEKTKEDGPGTPSDFPGPATHVATDCSDQDTHYSKVLADEVIQAPLGKIYSLMFGPASGTWMRNWLTNEQKCLELTMDDKRGLALDNRTRLFSYIKPLNGSIGPKQTKCICTETLDSMDLEKAVSVTVSTQTPDVPSGNVFSVKTKYCLSWGEGNGTRLQVNCTIEWTGKSWLKGPIEKGANDGQVQYTKDIIASLKAAVSSRRGAAAAVTSGKGKKKGRKGRESKSINRATDGASDSKPEAENWGLLEPLRPIFGPIVDILKPIFTGNILYGLLVGLLVASWFRFGFSGKGGSNKDLGFYGTPERVAAYEEIWRREESELWDWLEERVGMERMKEAKTPSEKKNMEDKLRDERMEERELDAAIRVTEEKLKVLKGVVEKKKSDVKQSSAEE